MYKFFLCFESMNYSKFIKIKKKWCFVSLHGEVFQLPAIKCFKTCFLAHRSTWASPGLNGIKDTWGCRCNTPDLVFCRSNQSVFCLIWNWFRAGTCSYECRVKRNGHSIGFALFFNTYPRTIKLGWVAWKFLCFVACMLNISFNSAQKKKLKGMLETMLKKK